MYNTIEINRVHLSYRSFEKVKVSFIAVHISITCDSVRSDSNTAPNF